MFIKYIIFYFDKISNYGISSLYKVVEGETKPFSAPEIFYEKE